MKVEIVGEIEKVNGKEVTYNDFIEKYVSKNKPVLLTNLMDGWRSCKDWVNDSGQPNLHFFATHFGKSKVQVAECHTRELTDQKRIEMTVTEFVERWSDTTSFYLKDWHFVKEYSDYEAYKTPVFFRDDWLNVFLDHYRMHNGNGGDDGYRESDGGVCCADYRFVYMGAKGSWTPLHADVFRSYSWSANVCGKKKWLFLDPSQTDLVFDRNLKSSVYDIFEDVSDKKFPGFKETVWLECIQEKNEIIFVPSGWYHQVQNLEDTISINHNWFNAYNLCWVWDLLLRDYKEARECIEDIRDICDDFESLCQRNLAANTGMNFFDFFIFLARLFLANIFLLYHLRRYNGISVRNSSNLDQHLGFNLLSIRSIALKMKSVDFPAGFHGSFDLRETLDDAKFLKLSISLGKTYGMIHMQEELNWSYDANKDLMSMLLEYRSHICTLEDFVKFMDYSVSKLGLQCIKT